MTDSTRRLLRILSDREVCRADETGLSQAELRAAIAELDQLRDDDNQRLHLVNTTLVADAIASLRLTAVGHGVARAL